jgi:hypothetical protein
MKESPEHAEFARAISEFGDKWKLTFVYHSDDFGTGIRIGGTHSSQYAVMEYAKALSFVREEVTKRRLWEHFSVKQDEIDSGVDPGLKGYTG